MTDPNSVNRFLTNPESESLEVNQAASVIPKIIKKKKVGERFPLLTEDINATRDIILQLVEFYSIVRRFYDDSKEKIDFFIGPDFIVPLLMYKATQLGVPTLDRATLEPFVEPSKGTNNFKNTEIGKLNH